MSSKPDIEACFASGLDLSEFSGGSTSSQSPTPTASAALLQVKAQEAQQKELHECEENRLGEIVSKYIERRKQKKAGVHDMSASRPDLDGGDPMSLMKHIGGIGGVLSGIHKRDETKPKLRKGSKGDLHKKSQHVKAKASTKLWKNRR